MVDTCYADSGLAKSEVLTDSVLGMSFSLPSQASQQQANHCHLYERFAGLHFALIVLRQAAVPTQPGETAFYYSPARLDAEAVRTGLSFHDLEVPAIALLLAPLRQLLAAVGGIRPNLLVPWREERKPFQQLAGAHRILDVSRGDIAGDGQV